MGSALLAICTRQAMGSGLRLPPAGSPPKAMLSDLLGSLCARGQGRSLRPLGDPARRGRVHRAHCAVVGSLRGLGALWTVHEARLGVLLRGLSMGGERREVEGGRREV